jgi:hypothetical protein
MLTAADEYLIHQTPHTFDQVATSDRNFYDRYFLNGYRRDGEVYFALAMGTYPNLGVFDTAFSVAVNGKQRFVRASRALGADRMRTSAGPISLQVIEPLRRVRIRIAKNRWGISGDLLMTARSLAMEEPHFFRRDHNGAVAMDYTRFTQHAEWSGKLTIDGTTHDLSEGTWWGSRDHSWGIRGVGGRDPRGAPPTAQPQFFWNWAPLNFERLCTLYTVSENADGSRWHQSGVVLTPFPDATHEEVPVGHRLTFKKGTRHISGATITLSPAKGAPLEIEFECLYNFLMKGVGYGEPKWGHGMWVGPDEVDGGEYDLATEDPMANLHVQTVSNVKAGRHRGIGVFEHIVLGPHAPYGFTSLVDGAR